MQFCTVGVILAFTRHLFLHRRAEHMRRGGQGRLKGTRAGVVVVHLAEHVFEARRTEQNEVVSRLSWKPHSAQRKAIHNKEGTIPEGTNAKETGLGVMF